MMANFSTPITKSFGSIGSVDLDARTFEAWASVEAVDRDREYVPISAFLDNLPIYMKNPVLLLGHQHKTTKDSLPIGKCLKLEHRGNGLWGKFYLATTQVGDDCLRLINEKCIGGLSCGFVPIKFTPHPADSQLPPDLRGKGITKYYDTVELVEISLLSIPSNRDSLVIQAEKGNRVANVILKGFDGEDTTNTLKEWLLEEKALGKKNSLWLGFSLSNDSKDELNKLSLDGKKCPKDELHLTLRYFGNVDDRGEVERLKNTLADLQYSLAMSYDLDPMDFETFKDDSLVARYANTKLSQLHESVNSLLDRDGLIYLEEFKFLKPHVTVSEGKDLLIPVGKPPKIKTDRLSLRWGDEVIQEFMPLRGTWDQFTTKVFGMWEEEEHPRDDDGQFSSKPSSSIFSPHDPKDQDINQKLDNILINQRKLNKDVQEIKDKDSWNAWAKNWVVKIGAVAGLYYGIKHAARNPEVREKIKNWLLNVATKEAKETDSIDKLLNLLTLTKKAIDSGKKLGAKGQEYARLEKFYLKMVEQLRRFVVHRDNELKTKEMTPEEFVEAEHPRASDGKFTDKSKGSGAKKTEIVDKNQSQKTSILDDPKYKDMSTKRPSSILEKLVHAGVVLGAVGTAAYALKKTKDFDSQMKVAAVLGVALFTQGGYVVMRDGDLLKSSENLKQAEVRADDIVKACKNPNPNKKALTNIINLQVENNVYSDSGRTRFQQQTIDYINSDEFKKDLAAKFGHLPEGGTNKVVLYSHPQFNIVNPETMLKNNCAYLVLNDKIYINVAIHENLPAVIGDGLTARDLILHEYAHSITMMHDEVQQRHLKEVNAFCDKLKGETMYLPSFVDLPFKWEPGTHEPQLGVNMSRGKKQYEITGHRMVEESTWDMVKDNIGLLPKSLFTVGEEGLKNSKMRTIIFEVKDGDGKTREISGDSFLQIMQMYGQTSTAKDPIQDINKNAVKIDSLDHRRIYGLTSVSEWISVKTEKGEKI